jgi:hypothetical protein
MTAAEKKLVERNLDLIFEFEKYVLEHPEITEKIPRNAVVFMKVVGDEKFNLWSERKAKKQARKVRLSLRSPLRNWAPFSPGSRVSPWSVLLSHICRRCSYSFQGS